MWTRTLGKEPGTQGKVCAHVANGEFMTSMGQAGTADSSDLVLLVGFGVSILVAKHLHFPWPFLFSRQDEVGTRADASSGRHARPLSR